jgi:hypothetical protein
MFSALSDIGDGIKTMEIEWPISSGASRWNSRVAVEGGNGAGDPAAEDNNGIGLS